MRELIETIPITLVLVLVPTILIWCGAIFLIMFIVDEVKAQRERRQDQHALEKLADIRLAAARKQIMQRARRMKREREARESLEEDNHFRDIANLFVEKDEYDVE